MSPPSLQDSLPAGWLSRYREGVEPSGSLQKVSDHPSSFSGLSLAQGKFHSRQSFRRLLHSITSSARPSNDSGTVMPSALAVLSQSWSALPLCCMAPTTPPHRSCLPSAPARERVAP